MRGELRPTFGRVRVLQFLESQNLSVDRALCAGDIGDIAAPDKVINKRSWGASNICALRGHGLVEAVGRTARGLDTWAISSWGIKYLTEFADVIDLNHWGSPWKRSKVVDLKKLVRNT